MKAQIFSGKNTPLEMREIEKPEPNEHQVLIKVSACGVCRTDLHILRGELSKPKLPLVMGHQIVGKVEAHGSQVNGIQIGDRVGVPWLGSSCRKCAYCKSGQENLCDKAQYTGYQIDGGFAEYTVAYSRYTFPIPEKYPDFQAAPLLCPGLIGYRAWRMTNGAKRIGFYGFGASAHILIQLVRYKGGEVYAFTKEGNIGAQEFAKSLGAVWAGTSEEAPPEKLDAAIIFAPVGELVPKALRAVKKGGTVVCAGIHMSDIPSFPYADLWEERQIRSVANLTRQDGEEFLKIAPAIPIETEAHAYPLEKVNEALDDLENGRFVGAAVIAI